MRYKNAELEANWFKNPNRDDRIVWDLSSVSAGPAKIIR